MANLHPHLWDDYIGQDRMKARLRVHIDAAYEAQRPLAHVLLTGPAGAGKTSLAHLIAEELTDPITELIMPMDRKTLIRNLRYFEGGVLFLDELHALSKRDQEVLLPVLTPSQGYVIDQKGRKTPMGWITVIAATTERGKIIEPLDDRFPIRPDFEPYTKEEMGRIVAGMARRMDVELADDVAVRLGQAAAGVPRNAESLVIAFRDLTETSGTPATVRQVLDLVSLDEDGLSINHRRYLEILAGQGGHAGQKTLETLLRLPVTVLWEVERLLMELGLLELTPTGRELTTAGQAKVRGGDEKDNYRRDYSDE